MSEKNTIHQRWIKRMNRGGDDPNYADSWAWEQCGGCCFWIPLAGVFGADWGVCSNPESQFDRVAMYEHDGCTDFKEDPAGWRTPQRFSITEQQRRS
ncbi:DUF3027 domain-containing protein [Arachnia propionica]|uniref:DUF3027 domain-containing protein n=1 Tax=Arachnia propionica TaxID=1750 RepID=A0A3P1T3N3_9ACTN|nr:DUF3027 domain-containing protein [Arachnia propionica]